MEITDEYFTAKWWYKGKYGEDGSITPDDFASFVAVTKLNNPSRTTSFNTLLIDMYRTYYGRDHAKSRGEYGYYEGREVSQPDDLLHEMRRSYTLEKRLMKLATTKQEKEYAHSIMQGDSFTEFVGCTYKENKKKFQKCYFKYNLFIKKLKKARILCE